jgi:hypothetical protein
MVTNEMTECIGCKNIKEERFPFNSKSPRWDDGEPPTGKMYIDTEHCGITQGGREDSYLEIFFCPVCGKKL